jgi:hypothetical protein
MQARIPRTRTPENENRRGAEGSFRCLLLWRPEPGIFPAGNGQGKAQDGNEGSTSSPPQPPGGLSSAFGLCRGCDVSQESTLGVGRLTVRGLDYDITIALMVGDYLGSGIGVARRLPSDGAGRLRKPH